MHPRHRSPGNGYRSSPMGIGGVAAASRISPESSMRGHGMYNSDYRGYNRGFGRGQPKPFQAAQPPPRPLPPPPRRTDIFMEAGRLATEYLVSKGLLPPNVVSGRLQNGSLKNQVGEFQGFRPQEGDSMNLTPDGRSSALARLGNASDAGSGRRRFGDEYNNPTGSRSYMRGRRRTGSFKNYGSDWGQGMGRSGPFPDKARTPSDVEGDVDSLSGYPEQQSGNGVVNDEQMSESAPKIDGAGDSESGLEKSQLQDDTSTKVSSDIGKDLPPENNVELAKMSDDVLRLSNEDTIELMDATGSDQVENRSEMKNAPIEHFAVEGDCINKNGGSLLSLCRFAKIPTKTRSSLTARGLKVDPVPATEEIKNCDKGQEENNSDVGPLMETEVPVKDVSVDASSVDASSNQIPHPKYLDSDIIDAPVIMSVEDAGELAPVYDNQEKFLRSQSFPDGSFVNKQESSEEPPGFGSCSSVIMVERGEKRTAEQTDSREGTKKPREWVPSVGTQTDEYSHLPHAKGKQLVSQEGRKLPDDEMILAEEQERPVDMSLYQSGDAGPCIDYSEEKQLFPSSFKICDLNLMEVSEVSERPHCDPMIIFPSIPEIKAEATPVDVDLSISNTCNVAGKYGIRGADGKEVEVIDLENDTLQEDNAFNDTERKEETEFAGLESFPNHDAQGTNDISDAQDGYGLMFSELLGTDISNCSSVPADIDSLHNDMALHNGEGILGDDESIYMSLEEIPISFMRGWEQPGQEYDKPF
ncbi:uncharacterized protein At4g26450 [Rhododendron vialii]|uniref:uncharacterized protein At4g26450 n=1 Tax=Rhododendron vialii TaxID=182163 RepID=UPI00265FE348|nr:uncharacterized protein At4g26450 [Rhododendron vialii]